jgi:hypothetical protein
MRKAVSTGSIATLAILLLGLSALAQADKATRRAARRKRDAGRTLLKSGNTAPDFELPRLDPFLKQDQDQETKPEVLTVKLSSLLNKQPVVLVFSSYT